MTVFWAAMLVANTLLMVGNAWATWSWATPGSRWISSVMTVNTAMCATFCAYMLSES